MYKSLLALTALSILSTAPLSARRIMCEDCEPQPEPECPEHLFVERSQLFITGEFLYWTIQEQVLDYAITKNKNTTALETFGIGKYQTVDFEWRPGFRVAATWYRCPRYWELTGEYTWFFDRGSDCVSNCDLSANYIGPTTQVIAVEPYQKSSSTVKSHYQLGDLYVARVFDPNPHLRMRLMGGLTIAYIDNEQKQRHLNFHDEQDNIEDKWSFFGGGVRAGLRVDWFWGYEFYLTGKFTFAGLVGEYENTAKQITTDDILVRDTCYHDNRLSLHSQIILGPSWQRPCDCWSIELFAGYEFNQWYNLQERYRTELSDVDASKETYISRGNYGLHGLTVRLTVGF